MDLNSYVNLWFYVSKHYVRTQVKHCVLIFNPRSPGMSRLGVRKSEVGDDTDEHTVTFDFHEQVCTLIY